MLLRSSQFNSYHLLVLDALYSNPAVRIMTQKGNDATPNSALLQGQAEPGTFAWSETPAQQSSNHLWVTLIVTQDTKRYMSQCLSQEGCMDL